jgi:hypothetical protein
VRGLMTILRELWSKEMPQGEVRNTYQYVLDLKDRFEETCEMVREELKKSRSRYKTNYDKKARPRHYKVGDLVLILLPTEQSKLLIQWKGPFPVEEREWV